MKKTYLYLTLTILLTACGGGKKNQSESSSDTDLASAIEASVIEETEETKAVKHLSLEVDYNQSLEGKSYQDLRLLLYHVYATYGMHIEEADAYSYFMANTDWYEDLLISLWEKDALPESMEDVNLYPEDQVFVEKIRKQMEILEKNNFIQTEGNRLGNVANVVNMFQFQDIAPEFKQKLEANNFVITRGNNIQLFHVYEENDYRDIPSFITTDLYLQAFHMYFSYTLRSLEQEEFIAILTELCFQMHRKSLALTNSPNEEVRKLAEFNTTFYAIPYCLLTETRLSLSAEQEKYLDAEIKKIAKEEDNISEYLGWTDVNYGYSLFKPRGHYALNEKSSRYFKAMMWLQTAPFCMKEEAKLNQAIFSSLLLADKNIYYEYKSIYEPIAFLIGLPDNLSFMDIADFLKKEKVQSLEDALQPENRQKVQGMLSELAKTRNKIKPEIEMSCTDLINFMPQRYLVDNDIIQKMVDARENSERAYPRGLDVFAAFGSPSANNILNNVYKDPLKWDKFTSRLDDNKTKFKDFQDWDKSVYNKWIKCLLELQRSDKQYPEFMQTEAWSRKNLNTALASWAELKHDAILYAEQPMAAECGGGGLPEPITRGYVEPNLKFWNQLSELLTLTNKVLASNNLLSEDLKSKNEQLADYVRFLIQVTKKELANEKLENSEYQTIEYMGSSIEYFTLGILEPNTQLYEWSEVKGPDKSVAVVADIYTRNVPYCNKDGILHVATGNVNNIYVVVPIGGQLFLTKGATFSYYEFVRPLGVRLTDEEWQRMLENGETPPEQEWMKDLIIGTQPDVDERVFYSSGC